MAQSGPAGAGRELSIALDAAERWRARADVRRGKIAALRRHRYTAADTPVRLAKRLHRLCSWVRAASEARGVPPPAEALPGPLEPADITDELVERQIGLTRDLLSVEFFELGLDAARSVGRVVTRGMANATGFLVSPELMMTNHHVLRDPAEAAASALELDVETNLFGVPKSPQTFRLRPERFFMSDRELDFSLCGVETSSAGGIPLAGYGFRPLIGEEGKVAIGEAVNIIQHPLGMEKQIVIRNNRLVDLPDVEPMRPFFHYEADTDRGSSGSPVFNDQWELVALHHSAVPKTNARGQLVDAAGRVIQDRADLARIVWIANEGIRVSQLVARIRALPLPNAQAASIRDATLQLWEVHGRPRMQERTAVSGAVDEARGGHERLAAQPAAPVVGEQVQLTVPLRITLALGEPKLEGPS